MNTAIPRIAASGRSNPKNLDKVRAEFDRLTRRRLGALAFDAVALTRTRRDLACAGTVFEECVSRIE
jgi:hypothetical protein